MQEDVEGNQFDPDDINVQPFLERGFLDVDHLKHKYNVEEANIGRPISVWTKGKRLFARFLLNPTEFGKEVHDYVLAHPGVLSFSIAGGVEKPIFGRGGKWDLVSCALTHVPMQPDAYAIALSGQTMTLRGIMSAFASDMRHNTVDASSVWSLYNYFKPMSGPVMGLDLAAWAWNRIGTRTVSYDGMHAPGSAIDQFRSNLFFPDQEIQSFALDTQAELARWKLLHPEDTHITDNGTFKSLEDAVAHLRYCMRLNPIQVATILGRLRGRGDVVRGWDNIAS